MQYRLDQKSGNKLSVLGFGCMRFTKQLGNIDMKKAEGLVLRAFGEGVNYFDTAYLYPGSEAALGSILAKNNLREQVYIATKLPIANCRSGADFDRFLDEQLARLQTGWVDYYLIHNISTLEQWRQLCDWGIEAWFQSKKESGVLRQVGFSFHGHREEFLRILDAWDWDFCQIQYNYLDEHNQAGVTGLRRAAEKGLPVIIMEPLMGGKLATGLPKKVADIFHKANTARTPAAWGLGWLWDQPEVTVVLSGMNSDDQLTDNLATAGDAAPAKLTEGERQVYREVVDIVKASYKVPCTGCGYCMPCPHKVNIPGCFAAYNTSYAMGRMTGLFQYATGTAAFREDRATASLCVGCGKCQTHCPQNIPIPQTLKGVVRRMEPFYFTLAMNSMRKRAKAK